LHDRGKSGPVIAKVLRENKDARLQGKTHHVKRLALAVGCVRFCTLNGAVRQGNPQRNGGHGVWEDGSEQDDPDRVDHRRVTRCVRGSKRLDHLGDEATHLLFGFMPILPVSPMLAMTSNPLFVGFPRDTFVPVSGSTAKL